MSTFFEVDGSKYVAADNITAQIVSIKSFASDTPAPLPMRPVAVLKAPEGSQIDAKWIGKSVDNLGDKDDVFTKDWASYIFICGTH